MAMVVSRPSQERVFSGPPLAGKGFRWSPPPLRGLRGRGLFHNMRRVSQLVSHGHLCTTGGRRFHPSHGGFSHVSPHASLLVDWSGRFCFSESFSAAGDGTGPLQFRCDPGSPVRSEQRCRDLSRFDGRGLLDHPLAVAGVLSTGLGQVRNAASPTRCHHLFPSLVGLDLEGVAVEPVGPGFGRHQSGRPLHRSVNQCRLPRQREPRGLENRARQRPARLETRMDRPFALVSDSGSRRMDRDRHERPRVVCPLAVPGDRCFGLASLDANHSRGQVPQERIAVEPPGHGICSQGRAAMARTRCGLPEDGSATARLHALGLLGVRSRRTMVRSDRLGAGSERRLVVRDAGLDRTGVQAAQTRRLAMADDSDDRPRPRKPVVAGAGCRHPLHTGRRWRSRRGRNAGRDGPRDGPYLANHARRRKSHWPIGSIATTCCVPDTFVARAQEASFGNQTTLGERLSAWIGGVGQPADRRTCVAKTPMETRTVVGDPSQFQDMP